MVYVEPAPAQERAKPGDEDEYVPVDIGECSTSTQGPTEQSPRSN